MSWHFTPTVKRTFSEQKSAFIIYGTRPNHDHPSQMPDGDHHDPHIEGKLVGAALLEELPLEEHARPLAKLHDGA